MKYTSTKHLYWVLLLGVLGVTVGDDEQSRLPTTVARAPLTRKLDQNRQEYIINAFKKLPKEEGKKEGLSPQSPDDLSSTTSVSLEWKNLKNRYAAQSNRSLEYLSRNTVPVVGPTEPTGKQNRIRVGVGAPGPGSALLALKSAATKAYPESGIDLPPTGWALTTLKASKNPLVGSISKRQPTTATIKPISGYWSTRLSKTTTPPSFTGTTEMMQDSTDSDMKLQGATEDTISPTTLLPSTRSDEKFSSESAITESSIEASMVKETTRLNITNFEQSADVANLERIIGNVSTDDNLVKIAKTENELKEIIKTISNVTLVRKDNIPQLIPNATENTILSALDSGFEDSLTYKKNGSEIIDQSTTSMTRATNATQKPIEKSSTEASLRESNLTKKSDTIDNTTYSIVNNTIIDKPLETIPLIKTKTTTTSTISSPSIFTIENNATTTTTTLPTPIMFTMAEGETAIPSTSTPSMMKITEIPVTIGNDIPDITTGITKKGIINFTVKVPLQNEDETVTKRITINSTLPSDNFTMPTTLPTLATILSSSLPTTLTQYTAINSTVAQLLATFASAVENTSEIVTPENMTKTTTEMSMLSGEEIEPMLEALHILNSTRSPSNLEKNSSEKTLKIIDNTTETIPTISYEIPSMTNSTPPTLPNSIFEDISTTSQIFENTTKPIQLPTTTIPLSTTPIPPYVANNTIKYIKINELNSSGGVISITEQPITNSTTANPALEKLNEIKHTLLEEKSATEYPPIKLNTTNSTATSPTTTATTLSITPTNRSNEIKPNLVTTEIYLSIPKKNLTEFHYDFENKNESTPIIFRETVDIDDEDVLLYNTTSNEKLPNVDGEIDGEDDGEDLEKDTELPTIVPSTTFKPLETTTKHIIKETSTTTIAVTPKMVPSTTPNHDEEITNINEEHPSTDVDESIYDTGVIIPMNVQLLVQATVKEMCRVKELLRDSIMKLFKTFASSFRSMDRKQIVILNLGSRECSDQLEIDVMPVHVRLLFTDINGQYDKAMTDSFVNLLQRGHFDFKYPIKNVDTVISHELNMDTENQLGGTVIAAIVISSIAGVCLLFLTILLVIMRKRQKGFNYGQRCTPVSLEDYSLDNISVYNSVRRKALRASKRSYGNPAFDDPVAISVPLNFAGLANVVTDKAKLEDEFSAVPLVTVKPDELPLGAETKNRYANVIPLPETRVYINTSSTNDTVDQFINANFVKGAKGADKFYIACQAPLQNTIADFWRMIWEQQSKIIIMLTDLHENGVEKSADYLPPSEVLDCHRVFGDLQVTLKKREAREKYIISSLQLKNLETNLWREVTHLWYISWPIRGIPDDPSSMIAFLIEARSFAKSGPPVVVHCSPGTGRTGTVIAIDMAIRDFETDRTVDIPKTVYNIRRERAGSVQTNEQYRFIYQVLHLYATKLTGGGLDSI